MVVHGHALLDRPDELDAVEMPGDERRHVLVWEGHGLLF
jgi:hypothetical protein